MIKKIVRSRLVNAAKKPVKKQARRIKDSIKPKLFCSPIGTVRGNYSALGLETVFEEVFFSSGVRILSEWYVDAGRNYDEAMSVYEKNGGRHPGEWKASAKRHLNSYYQSWRNGNS